MNSSQYIMYPSPHTNLISPLVTDKWFLDGSYCLFNTEIEIRLVLLLLKVSNVLIFVFFSFHFLFQCTQVKFLLIRVKTRAKRKSSMRYDGGKDMLL